MTTEPDPAAPIMTPKKGWLLLDAARLRDPLWLLRLALVVAVPALLLGVSDPASMLAQWGLPFVGVAGALVANSTGIGGGVVFVPAFDHLGLENEQIVGTSLLIQSFGMSMGALTFLARRRSEGPVPGALASREYRAIVLLAVIPSVLAGIAATHAGLRPDLPLKLIYKAISLLLVVLIIGSTLTRARGNGRFSLGLDGSMLIFLGLIGGLFVGWISIGVGELVGVYLLLRGFRTSEAIGLAVLITALCVLALQATHFPGLPADVEFGLMVTLGALPGAFLAPYLLQRVGPARVKGFCAFWILLSIAVA
ncbi:sulfite exporter TauE/SafE family protein [Primorskyibacter sp. 2E107]|uniref:sulfite exporter TauE/SafE family protein n=1 Tax=Primorskyibacter sp. 2E107 TaxID=3403458 RepID=UPI003AF68886